MANVEMTSRGIHREYHNSDLGAPELDDGQVGHIGLITKYKACTTGADTIMTVTTGKKGYIKALTMYNTHTAGQTFKLEDTAGTVYMTYLATGECKDIIMEKPWLEVAAGAVTGDAGTATGINVTTSYYEK